MTFRALVRHSPPLWLPASLIRRLFAQVAISRRGSGWYRSSIRVAEGRSSPALRRDRDQLWAEAAAAEAQSGSLVLPTHLLGAVQEAQEERRERDPWEDILADVTGTVAHGEERIPTDEILTLKLGIGHKDQTKTHTLRVKQAMNVLGWDGPKVFRIAGKLCRGYSRVTDVTDRPDDP